MSRFFAIVILCLLALYTTVTYAGERRNYIILHGVSKHSNLGRIVWQERNYGIGYRAQNNLDLSYQFGAYRNSYNKETVYALVQHTPIGNNTLRAGVFGGAASGYNTPVAAGFMLNYYKGSNVITVRYVPSISSQTTFVVTAEVGFKF